MFITLSLMIFVFPGIYYHMIGDVYDGEFANNEMEGTGTYRKKLSDGSFVTGIPFISWPLLSSYFPVSYFVFLCHQDLLKPVASSKFMKA